MTTPDPITAAALAEVRSHLVRPGPSAWIALALAALREAGCCEDTIAAVENAALYDLPEPCERCEAIHHLQCRDCCAQVRTGEELCRVCRRAA